MARVLEEQRNPCRRALQTPELAAARPGGQWGGAAQEAPQDVTGRFGGDLGQTRPGLATWEVLHADSPRLPWEGWGWWGFVKTSPEEVQDHTPEAHFFDGVLFSKKLLII